MFDTLRIPKYALFDKTIGTSHALGVMDICCAILLQKLMLQPGTLATKVLCLTQVVTVDELKDDEDYEDILEDMRLECGKFGMCLHLFSSFLFPSL